MAANVKVTYDREGDILYVEPPYAEQESEELGDGVVARLNPQTNEIENVEIMFFSTRLLRKDSWELPIVAEVRLAPDRP